jgi:hypothetical protein
LSACILWNRVLERWYFLLFAWKHLNCWQWNCRQKAWIVSALGWILVRAIDKHIKQEDSNLDYFIACMWSLARVSSQFDRVTELGACRWTLGRERSQPIWSPRNQIKLLFDNLDLQREGARGIQGRVILPGVVERPVEVLADLLEDGGADLREPDLVIARLGEATLGFVDFNSIN